MFQQQLSKKKLNIKQKLYKLNFKQFLVQYFFNVEQFLYNI